MRLAALPDAVYVDAHSERQYNTVDALFNKHFLNRCF